MEATLAESSILTRALPIERLRVCDYAAVKPGELFLWPSSGSGSQLGLMVHVIDEDKTIYLPIWLTDDAGRFIGPTFELVNGAGTVCVSLGSDYRLLVDPLDQRHELNTMLDFANGPAISVINDKLAMRVPPVPGRGYRRPIYVYVYAGSQIPPNELRVHTAAYSSWQLVLPDASRPNGRLLLGTYSPAADGT